MRALVLIGLEHTLSHLIGKDLINWVNWTMRLTIRQKKKFECPQTKFLRLVSQIFFPFKILFFVCLFFKFCYINMYNLCIT